MRKYILGIIFLLIIIVCIISSFFIRKTEIYSRSFYYMDTSINIKIYTDKKNCDAILNEVEHIYNEYHILNDRYNSYDNVNNLYTILHNKSNDKYLDIDPKLYEMISYGLKWNKKSNGKISINLGNVVDLWKNYSVVGVGIPSVSELKLASLNSNEVKLKDGKLLNNHPNIYLGTIARGFATEEVVAYLEKNGINKYIINAGGSVRVGKHYNNSSYGIGLENPNSNGNSIYDVVYGNNISVVTTGGYIDFYEYNGVKYHYIIDPDTLYPSTFSKSVSVISLDSKMGEVLSNILYLMPIEDGIEYLKSFDDVEAIWYTNDNNIITTNGFSKYKKKKS